MQQQEDSLLVQLAVLSLAKCLATTVTMAVVMMATVVATVVTMATMAILITEVMEIPTRWCLTYGCMAVGKPCLSVAYRNMSVFVRCVMRESGPSVWSNICSL